MGNCIARINRVNEPTTQIGVGRSDVVENVDGSVESRNNLGETAALLDNKINVTLTGSTSLKAFELAELKSATRNFRPETVLGEGIMGTVFKGWIDDKTFAPSIAGHGMAVAVKQINRTDSGGLKELQATMKHLGQHSHPNVVKLLGHCLQDNQFLLVYEYMERGSLENHLFRRGSKPLLWDDRLKIAIDMGEGLTYLHSSEESAIYRDFNTSDVLLDKDFNAKLSDYGLARFSPIIDTSSVAPRVVGTYVYASPEYVETGHLTMKSDVYGFGIVLLELLTGLRALDMSRPIKKQNLLKWVKVFLSIKRKLKKIMDPRLQDRYPLKDAVQVGQLILQCLETAPKNRPSMKEVLEILTKIRDRGKFK
ncbi:Probable serine/threonine-protein kinase PIX13 [Linum perenne]